MNIASVFLARARTEETSHCDLVLHEVVPGCVSETRQNLFVLGGISGGDCREGASDEDYAVDSEARVISCV